MLKTSRLAVGVALLLLWSAGLGAQEPAGKVQRANTGSSAGVFDVTAYGAVGNGSTDSTTAIQAAENACEASPTYGTLEFPAGVYLISSTLVVSKPCSWRGAGPQGTRIVAQTALTPMIKLNNIMFDTLAGGNLSLQHNGIFSGFTVLCNAVNPTVGRGRQGAGIELIDTLAAKFENVVVASCVSGIWMNAVAWFDERNLFRAVTGENNTQMFLIQQSAGDTFASFGYNRFEDIEFNTYLAADAVFRLKGQPDIYSNHFQISGNMVGNDYIFDLSGGQAINLSSFDVRAESSGGTSSIAFYSGSAGSAKNACGLITSCVVEIVPATISLPNVALFGGSLANWGRFNVGAISSGSITLSGGAGSYSFSPPYGFAPVCTANDVSNGAQTFTLASSATAVSITNGSGSDVINFLCVPGMN